MNLKKDKFPVDEFCILQVLVVFFSNRAPSQKKTTEKHTLYYFSIYSCYSIVKKVKTYVERSRNIPSFGRDSQNISRARFERAGSMLRPCLTVLDCARGIFRICFGPKPCLHFSFLVKLCHRSGC